MIGVEQIRILEDRIEKALAFIGGLRSENAALQTKTEESEESRSRAEDRAAAAESRVRELEEAIATFKRDQSRIEEGILHALEKLDAFEDLVLRSPSTTLQPNAEPATGMAGSTSMAADTVRGAAERNSDPVARVSVQAEPSRPVAPQPAADELEIF